MIDIDSHGGAMVVDDYGLPGAIDEDVKEIIKKHLDAKDIDSDTLSANKSKVTPEMCSAMNELYNNGTSVSDITSYFPVQSHTTVYYHINEECTHEYRSNITYDECGWMIYYAKQGAPARTLAMLYNSSKKAVTTHVTGKCSHDHGIEPLSSDELEQNSYSRKDKVTSICQMCGDTFTHEAYRDRKFCSKRCSATYNSKKYHGKLDE